MKAGFILIFLFISLDVNAFTCERKGNSAIRPGGGTERVIVPINREINIENPEFFNLGQYFRCKNDAPSRFIDILDITNDGITTVLPNDYFRTEADINGAKYPLPLNRLVNVFRLSDGNWHDIPIVINYKLNDSPGKLVRINTGDEIARVNLHKYSIPAQTEDNFTWILIAGNDAIYTSGTCEINNGSDIVVNFGSIAKFRLNSSGIDDNIRRTIEVPYRCQNPVSIPISITLSSVSAGFSSDAIALDNKNLGVKMYYQGKLVKPGDSIKTNLLSGVGSNIFDFYLVKKDNSEISAGLFSGSAVLVMSAD